MLKLSDTVSGPEWTAMLLGLPATVRTTQLCVLQHLPLA